MMKPVKITEVLDSLPVLDGRTPETSEDDAADAFATLNEFNNGGIFVGSFIGESPWERHSAGDELVQIIKGETEMTLLIDEAPSVHRLGAGMMIVVPRGVWHKFNAPDGVSVLTATPTPTDHSNAEDPRST